MPSLFDSGSEPKRIQDSFFGEITLQRSSDPRDSYWVGSLHFPPVHARVECVIDAGLEGPSPAQRDFVRVFEQRYQDVLHDIARLLAANPLVTPSGTRLAGLEGLALSHISVPNLGDPPWTWELMFSSSVEGQVLRVEMSDFAPVQAWLDS
jgi:hypothetical protein